MTAPGFSNMYSQNAGMTPSVPFSTHFDTRAPTTTDINYPLLTIWNWAANGIWILNAFSSAGGTLSATWVQVSDADGPVESVVGTANQVTVTTSSGTATVSLPSAITTPGSLTTTTTLSSGTTLTGGTGITATTGDIIASTGNITSTLGSMSAATTMTAGTGITSTTGNIVATAGAVNAGTSMTATLGNITATNGNFVSSFAGKGLFFNANTATGAAASPVVLNSRAGQVVFTTVSIAAAADLTLTITNSEITGSSTQVICDVSGATTGSAISVKSKTASSGSLALVITNGTGATTTTSDITVTFLVIN